MSQEIAELTDSVPWKWWAKYQKFDEQNARVEVVDLFHFLISLAQVLGMSADDVFQAYLKKNEVNFQAPGQRLRAEGRARLAAHLSRPRFRPRLRAPHALAPTLPPGRRRPCRPAQWRADLRDVLITGRQIAPPRPELARRIDPRLRGRGTASSCRC